MKTSPNISKAIIAAIVAMAFIRTGTYSQEALTYPIIDTDQEIFYDTIVEISAPLPGELFYGQDAQYTGNVPDYQDNGDGTITDLITGLMWSQSPDMDGDGDIDYADKMSYEESMAAADTFSLAGYTDWRLPSIKEMYSLIVFSGKDPSGFTGTNTDELTPFIDTNYFDFAYGDQSAGERIIDAQMASSNIYVGTTMGGNETMFGVNFADGRIKGYPTGPMPGQTEDKQFYVFFVRGNAEYGVNDFHDNGDGTITDNATGLMWTKDDDGNGMTWPEALTYAENSVNASYNDWRLPNAKELQSLLDYSRAPTVTSSAAIDPIFNCSTITDEGGNINYPFYWSGTTHASFQADAPGGFGAYVCFGEALGFMEMPPGSGNFTLMDVHGAGAQRSDPKVGNPANWPYGHGPQGDVIRIFNYVRLVRDAENSAGYEDLNINSNEIKVYPNPVKESLNVILNKNTSCTVNIYNTFGQVLLSTSFEDSNKLQLNISHMPTGVYLLSIVYSSGNITERFVKI